MQEHLKHCTIYGKDVVRRFLKKISPADENGCRLFMSSLNKKGYGTFWANGRPRLVHRLVWEMANNQPFPKGLQAAHVCPGKRKKNCCNPNHIRPMTHAEHTEDRITNGEQSRGEKHSAAVSKYRREHPECVKRGDEHYSRLHPEKLARGQRHGSKTRPEKVLRGDKHPSRLRPERLARGANHGCAILTENDVREIRRSLATCAVSGRSLAKKFGVSPATISAIFKGRLWKHVSET